MATNKRGYLDICRQRCPSEIAPVKALGESIGYGHLMFLASALWGEMCDDAGTPGGEFVTGPCRAMMVPCGCRKGKTTEHCDWCCGTGLVTERVAKAQAGTEAIQ